MVKSKLQKGVSEKVEYVPKQVEHVVPVDTNYDFTSPNDQPNSPHLEHEQDRSIAHDRPRRNANAPSQLGFEVYVAYVLQVAEEVEPLNRLLIKRLLLVKSLICG
ncbi:hypothetical protein Tco_1543725, partial [Tanacetum coccineum]